MAKRDDFVKLITEGYTYGEPNSWCCYSCGETLGNASVKNTSKTLNRHGLIAGATGTEKQKTIQVLSEQLSSLGIPVLMMDIKGDFSGIAKKAKKTFITER
jgi:hypothetical protein